MNKVTAFTLSGVLLFGAVACNPNDVAKTDWGSKATPLHSSAF